MVGAVLVIGSGIGGMKCSLELAESGFKVYLSDQSPFIGGTLTQLDKWFPDNHCGMCKILPVFSRDESSQFCLRRGLFHPNIELLPLSTAEKVEGEAGDFLVTLRIKPRGVKEELCIGCDLCAQSCPVAVASEFNEGLENRKAIYLRNPLALSSGYSIDWDSCTKCGACVEKCPTAAIDLSPQDEARQLEVGAIVLSTGFEEFDPRSWTQYGYKRYPNVITSIQLERMLSASGPTEGEILRPSDGQPPRSIAFLQCVGSRVKERDYCSSACCMYALKEAILAKEKDPELDAEIFFMDLRAFGKGYYRYYEQAKEDFGTKFTRCRVPQIKQDPKTKNLLFSAKAEDGLERREFELVVLSVGQTPSPRFFELSEILGIERNQWGFCKTRELSPVATSREGIYVCGSASAPKDIADTLVEAGAAACQVSILLSSRRSQSFTMKGYPEELDVREMEARVAIFLCRCGEEIASAIDMQKMVDFAKGLPVVVYVEEIPYLCLKDAVAGMKGRIKGEKANRVVLAACSAFAYKRLFIDAIRDVGLNPALLEVVDIREQLSWIHRDHKEAATDKGKRLLAIALEKVGAQEPLHTLPQRVEPRALVIGGGLAGLTAAQSLAEQGFEAHLVERTAEWGGNLRHIFTILEGGEPQALLQDLIKRAEENPLTHLHQETEVIQVSGYAGNFETTLKDRNGALQPLKVGAIIVATGGEAYEPKEYCYGESERVITQTELEKQLASGKLDPRELNSVVMIQCVGSRDEERPYCSRMCCSQALKNALSLKERNPEIDIFVLYRDVMSYGFKEEYYTHAREKGVLFVNYDLDHKPEVRMEGERLVVKATEPMLEGVLKIEPDLLVLSTGIVPNDNKRLAQMLGLELSEDGFFKEAEVKFRPVDFVTNGIFLCGLAHSPRGVAESIVQAQAAAQRAACILSRERLESGRIVSEVNERRCSGCELCISVCPYNARFKDTEKGVVVVIEALCQGCGACVAICPSGAAKLRGFTDRQVFSMVDAIL
ncbi:MAG: CoB--CoM heterodisulfide reductase iron-sulfur subunit A family protein [Dehalococcoidia bacterium]|nr:CoB--CoM heterodisulfide reductase iron-sulfur subunit A family protein [Dehalococcoidia bacterium]